MKRQRRRTSEGVALSPEHVAILADSRTRGRFVRWLKRQRLSALFPVVLELMQLDLQRERRKEERQAMRRVLERNRPKE